MRTLRVHAMSVIIRCTCHDPAAGFVNDNKLCSREPISDVSLLLEHVPRVLVILGASSDLSGGHVYIASSLFTKNRMMHVSSRRCRRVWWSAGRAILVRTLT